MAHVIDADTHIAESEHMWQMIDPDMHHRRPVVVSVPNDTLYKTRDAFWLIDGNIFPKPAGKGSFPLITPSAQTREMGRDDMLIASREMTDIGARLKDMDRLGIGSQVVYPTLFLIYLTDDADFELALVRAYNRYIAQACALSEGRIRWVMIPPLKSVKDSIEEMNWAKENGAVGVFFRGIERDRTMDDPYFFPIYEEAQRLDLPICAHVAAGCPPFTNIFDLERNHTFAAIRLPPIIGFRDLVANRIPEMFPQLRIGIIEAGASWVPFIMHALKRQLGGSESDWGPSLFRDYRLYIAAEADEDIPYLRNYIPDERLLIGSDYGHHGDPANEPELVKMMEARQDIPASQRGLMMVDNPARFYGM